jgi:predicted nucleotidyltransferase
VAAPTIFTEAEQAFLRELRLRRVEFMIVGLAAAALQGTPAVTQDIDLWFKDLGDRRIHEALARVGGIYVPPTATTPPMFAGKNVALFDIVLTMHGLRDFGRELRNTRMVRIGGTTVPVLSLERIIVSKKAANREKDRLVLPVLEDALATLKTTRRK